MHPLNTKGITPIIAVILLLMMTIAIAGLAYTWLQRTQVAIQSGVENTTTTLLGGLKVNLKVEGYNTTCTAASSVVSVRVYGRNAGTEPAKNLQLYVADGLLSGASNTTLNPGVTTSWLAASGEACSTWINKTRVVKISSDETSAEKSFTFTCGTGNC